MKSLHRIRLPTSQGALKALAVLLVGCVASSAVAADHGNKALSASGPAARAALDHHVRSKDESCIRAAHVRAAGSCEDPAVVEQRERELQQLALHAAMVDSSFFGQLRVLREPAKQASLAKKSKRARAVDGCESLK